MISHEVGHSLGLPHNMTPTDIMAPVSGHASQRWGDGTSQDGTSYVSDRATLASVLPAPRRAPCGSLEPEVPLFIGETQSSCDGRFGLVMQGDGNLVFYENGVTPLWHTGTNGTSAHVAIMQGDGNFVLYDANRTPLFHTGTYGNPGAALAVQTDGHLVVSISPTRAIGTPHTRRATRVTRSNRSSGGVSRMLEIPQHSLRWKLMRVAPRQSSSAETAWTMRS